MSKFEIGDYLRVTDANEVAGGFDESAIYEVVDINEEDGSPVVMSEGCYIGFFKSELTYLEKVNINPIVERESSEISEIKELISKLSERIDSLERLDRAKLKDELLRDWEQEIQKVISQKWNSTEELKAEVKADSLLKRKDIINKAKKFLSDYCHENYGSYAFEIDQENKTVYAKLLMSFGSSYEVIETAKAVCGKKDVYNETLGKAIALGRLIGEDTFEFENATQPLDYVVGQTIEAGNTSNQKHTGMIYKIEGDKLWIENQYGANGYVYKDADDRYANKNYKAVIVNDTNAEYE